MRTYPCTVVLGSEDMAVVGISACPALGDPLGPG